MLGLMEMREERTHVLRPREEPARAFTYRDYLSWGEDVHVELIDGTPHMMAAPTLWHQRMVRKLFRQVDEFLAGKTCEAFTAPVDVRLFPEGDESDTVVVQPDVLVVCDAGKLSDGRACKGAPDFVVEVVSEGSRGKDFGEKRMLYEKAGVREYWIVDKDRVCKYVLIDGMYRETAYRLDKNLEIGVDALAGCVIGFRDIVEASLP